MADLPPLRNRSRMGHDAAVELWNHLDELLAENDRVALVSVLACIESARVFIHERLYRPLDKQTPGTRFLLSAHEMAKATGLSARYFYDRAGEPFAVRLSARRIRFDIARFMEEMRLGQRGSGLFFVVVVFGGWI